MATIDLTIDATKARPGKKDIDRMLDQLERKAVNLQRKFNNLFAKFSPRLKVSLRAKALKSDLAAIQQQIRHAGPLYVRVVPRLDRRHRLSKAMQTKTAATVRKNIGGWYAEAPPFTPRQFTPADIQKTFANQKGFMNEALLRNTPQWRAMEKGRRDVADLYRKATDAEAKIRRQGGSEWAQYKAQEKYVKQAEKLNKLHDQRDKYLKKMSSTERRVYNQRLKNQESINKGFETGNTLLDKRLKTQEKVKTSTKKQSDEYKKSLDSFDKASKAQQKLYEQGQLFGKSSHTYLKDEGWVNLDKMTDREKRLAKALNQKTREAEKSFKTLNNLEAATLRAKNQNDKFNRSVSQGTSRGRFWNSNFTKFSVVMSGLAATLFVFQEVVQWINAAIDKVVQFEKALRSVTNLMGNQNAGIRLIEGIRSSTSYKASEIGDAASKLITEGYSRETISKNLVKAMDYAETGFVNISEAMEIATTDIYGMSSALDYYVEMQKNSAEELVKKISADWDKTVESFSSAFLDFIKGMKRADQEMRYDELGVATMITPRPGGKLIKYGEEEEKAPVIYSPTVKKAMFTDLQKSLGSYVPGYFKEQTRALESLIGNGKEPGLYKKVLDSIGNVTKEDYTALVEYGIEKSFDLIWEAIIAKFTKLTPGEKKSYESIFKETGFYHPMLERQERLIAQKESIREKERAARIAKEKGLISKEGYLTIDQDFNNFIQGIEEQYSKRLFDIFEKRNKKVKERGESTFKDFGVMTPEYEQYRKNLNYELSKLRKTAKTPMKEELGLKDEIDFFKDKNKRMLEDQEYMFSQMKTVSKDYYEVNKKLIYDQYRLNLKIGMDTFVANRKYADETRKLNEIVFRSSSDGFQAALYNMSSNVRDNFEMIYDFTKNTFQGIENRLVNLVVTGKFEWKSLVDSMIADLARMTIQRAFYGEAGLFDGFTGFLSNIFSLSASGPQIIGLRGKASGGPVHSGSTYIVGEKGPEILSMGNQSGNIIPNHKIGSQINENINTYNISINAVDASSFVDLAKRNSGAIINVVNENLVNHGVLTNTIRRTT